MRISVKMGSELSVILHLGKFFVTQIRRNNSLQHLVDGHGDVASVVKIVKWVLLISCRNLEGESGAIVSVCFGGLLPRYVCHDHQGETYNRDVLSNESRNTFGNFDRIGLRLGVGGLGIIGRHLNHIDNFVQWCAIP